MEVSRHISSLAIASGIVSAVTLLAGVFWATLARDGKSALRMYLAALIGPAASGYFASRSITSGFADMAQGGIGGIGSVAAILSESVDCGVAAFLVSWVVLLFAAIGATLRRSASQDSGASHVAIGAAALATIIAVAPFALLHRLSSFILAVANPQSELTISLGDISTRTAGLLITCAYSALAAAAIITVALILSHVFIRPTSRTRTLLILWIGQGFLGVGAWVNYKWSRALYEVATRGSLQ